MASHLASTFSPGNLLLGNAAATTKPKAQAAGTSSTGTSSSDTSSSGLTGTDAGTTFLNLLVKELQNQDPDSPVDSTQMVGQMISLNQLDQLISINQTLTTATTPVTAARKQTAGVSPLSSSAEIAQRADLLNSLQNGSTTSQNEGAAQAAAMAASDPNQTLNLSNLNIPNGGK